MESLTADNRKLMPRGLPSDFAEIRLPGDITLWVREAHIPHLAALFPENEEPFLTARDARIIKRSRTRFVVRLSIPGTEGRETLFCKRYRPSAWQETLRNTFQGPRGLRELRAVIKAQELGIITPGVIGAGQRLIQKFPHESYIFYQAIPNAPSLFDICINWHEHRPPLSHRRALIRQVAEAVVQAHQLGLRHDDFSAKHVLIQNYPRTDGRVYIIDLDNAAFAKRLSPYDRAFALTQLASPLLKAGLQVSDSCLFLKDYLDIWGGNSQDWKAWWRYIKAFITMRKETEGGFRRFRSTLAFRIRRQIS